MKKKKYVEHLYFFYVYLLNIRIIFQNGTISFLSFHSNFLHYYLFMVNVYFIVRSMFIFNTILIREYLVIGRLGLVKVNHNIISFC